MRRLPFLPALAAVVALIAGACGSDDSPTIDVPAGGTSSTASTTSPTAATSESTTPTTERADETGAGGGAFSTDQVSKAASGHGLLTTIRDASHEGFHRVVFEFDGDVPGYQVRYIAKPVTEDASGNDVEVKGDFPLEVRFEPASGYDLENDEATYKGPSRIDVSEPPVTEIVRTGDFEAVLHWVVGLSAKRPFRVSTLKNPSRVVVDIQT